MIEMPCNYHRIEISMGYMWFMTMMMLFSIGTGLERVGVIGPDPD